jgi:hypothetical protein
MTLPDGLRAAEPRERLDARYGRQPAVRRRNRLVAWLLVAAGTLAVVAWGVWSGVGGATGDRFEVTTRAFTVRSDAAVSVTWSVTGSTKPLLCTIEADAEDRSTVGLVEVRVPAGGGTGTTVVRTVRLAVTGLISACRPA